MGKSFTIFIDGDLYRLYFRQRVGDFWMKGPDEKRDMYAMNKYGDASFAYPQIEKTKVFDSSDLAWEMNLIKLSFRGKKVRHFSFYWSNIEDGLGFAWTLFSVAQFLWFFKR